MNLYKEQTETNKPKQPEAERSLVFPTPTSRYRCVPVARQAVWYAERTEIQTKFQIPTRKPNLVPINTRKICVAPRGNERLLFQAG